MSVGVLLEADTEAGPPHTEAAVATGVVHRGTGMEQVPDPGVDEGLVRPVDCTGDTGVATEIVEMEGMQSVADKVGLH